LEEPSSYTERPVTDTPGHVYCDEAQGNTGAGAAAVLISPSSMKPWYAARLHFNKEIDKCTNNIAKYEAVLLGLCKLRVMGVQNCILKTDSNMIPWQIEKECIARVATLERYLALVRRIENYFSGFFVEYIKRTKNTKADELVKSATRKTTLPLTCFSKHLKVHE
jgi:ribonuclease HI